MNVVLFPDQNSADYWNELEHTDWSRMKKVFEESIDTVKVDVATNNDELSLWINLKILKFCFFRCNNLTCMNLACWSMVLFKNSIIKIHIANMDTDQQQVYFLVLKTIVRWLEDSQKIVGGLHKDHC